MASSCDTVKLLVEVDGVSSSDCSPPTNSSFAAGHVCSFTCAYAYSVGPTFQMTGQATCTSGSWVPNSPSHQCTLDLGFLGVVGGGALIVVAVILIIVVVCVKRKRGARNYRGLSTSRSDPFAREPSASGHERLLDSGNDPFASVPTPSNRDHTASRNTQKSAGAPKGGKRLTNKAVAHHRGKHRNTNAAVERWANDASSVRSRGTDNNQLSDSVLFDDLTDEERLLAARTDRKKQKSSKKSSKKHRSHKSRSNSVDDTSGNSVGSTSRSKSSKRSKKHSISKSTAERASDRLSKSAHKKQKATSTALVVADEQPEEPAAWFEDDDGNGSVTKGAKSGKKDKRKKKDKKKLRRSHADEAASSSHASSAVSKKNARSPTGIASSDSEVELPRTNSGDQLSSAGKPDFDDNASVYSEQSYMTSGGTRKTRKVPSRTRGRYRRGASKTSKQRLASRQMALPGLAQPKSAKKGNRPLAPVLETDHDDVRGSSSTGVAAATPSESALVVSNKGTLDDSDDDFFS